MAKYKSRKLPNRYGTISKLSGNRRKPYIIKGFEGYDDDGKIIRPIIGYAIDYTEALGILSNYNKEPYDLDYANLSTKDLFNLWYADLYNKVKSKKLGEKRYKGYKSTFDKYFKTIHNQKYILLKTNDMQKCFDECIHGFSTKTNMKIIFNGLFEKSQDLEMPIKKNFVENCYIGEKEDSEKHIPFSTQEIKKLWNNIDNTENIDLILINIYTGCRPNELLEPNEIHFEERYFIGGSKTEAGRNRIIPIHEKIANLFKKRFIDSEININYRKYYKSFLAAMNKLEMNHTPYDCRHTFATEADNSKLNDLCIKLIMGHSVQDITKGVYTHKTPQQLVEEVNKIDF